MKSALILFILVMFLLLGCFSAFDAPYPRGDMAPSKDFPCPAVTWNNTYDGGQKVSLDHALIWHAAEEIKVNKGKGVKAESVPISTPCGDSELTCAIVKRHIEGLEGKVIRAETCAVVWQPPSSWYDPNWNWRH